MVIPYDPLPRQATSVALPGGLSQRYTYNQVGQRTGMGGSYARTLLPAVMPAATYDSNNRLTVWNGRNLIYDPNGNLTGDGLYTYTWNTRNELTEVRQGGTVIGAYAYDALGRRYSRTLNGTTTTYLYDGISAVQERVGSTNTDLFGLGVDNYFSRTTGNNTQTYLKDGLGSTLALVDGSGNLTTAYTYGPYGQTGQTGAADSNSTGYTGREMDAGNLYYYRARYYNTELHRFISQDPIGLAGSMNWYAYVDGNPISLVDPTGEHPVIVGMLLAHALYHGYKEPFNDARRFGLTWLFETAPATSYFGPESDMSRRLVRSRLMGEAYDKWIASGMINNKTEWTDNTFFSSTADLLLQRDIVGHTIGNFGATFSCKADGSIWATIENTSGWESFTRIPGTQISLRQNISRGEGTYGGNWKQIYTFKYR